MISLCRQLACPIKSDGVSTKQKGSYRLSQHEPVRRSCRKRLHREGFAIATDPSDDQRQSVVHSHPELVEVVAECTEVSGCRSLLCTAHLLEDRSSALSECRTRSGCGLLLCRQHASLRDMKLTEISCSTSKQMMSSEHVQPRNNRSRRIVTFNSGVLREGKPVRFTC